MSPPHNPPPDPVRLDGTENEISQGPLKNNTRISGPPSPKPGVSDGNKPGVSDGNKLANSKTRYESPTRLPGNPALFTGKKTFRGTFRHLHGELSGHSRPCQHVQRVCHRPCLARLDQLFHTAQVDVHLQRARVQQGQQGTIATTGAMSTCARCGMKLHERGSTPSGQKQQQRFLSRWRKPPPT